MCLVLILSNQSGLWMRFMWRCSTYLEPRYDVKVLLHVSAKHLIDGTVTPHAYQLW